LEGDDDGTGLAAVAPMALLLAGRQQGRWLADEVTRRLAEAASGPVVSRLLSSSDTRLRRAAYQVLTDTGELDLDRAVQAALLDRDIVIRSRCAVYAARLAAEAGAVPSARHMLASRTPIVRAEALGALNRLGEFEAAEGALRDSSSLVRGTARFYLKPRGFDVLEAYRRMLRVNGDSVTPGIVAGLAEVGTGSDADAFHRLVSHPRAKVRVEALRGLAALAPSINIDEMLALIVGDPSAAVIRQATAVVVARGAGIGTERLQALLDSEQPVPVRLAARQLLASRDGAWRLAVNVMLLGDADYVVAGRAASDLAAALKQQLYTRPSGETAALLAAHLPDADRLLPAQEVRLLRFIVGMPLPTGAPAMAVPHDAAEKVPPESHRTMVTPDVQPRRLRWLRRR
jgi:hypothetical protein